MQGWGSATPHNQKSSMYVIPPYPHTLNILGSASTNSTSCGYCNIAVSTIEKIHIGILLWFRGLRILWCCCSSYGYGCGAGGIPGLGTLACLEEGGGGQGRGGGGEEREEEEERRRRRRIHREMDPHNQEV